MKIQCKKTAKRRMSYPSHSVRGEVKFLTPGSNGIATDSRGRSFLFDEKGTAKKVGR